MKKPLVGLAAASVFATAGVAMAQNAEGGGASDEDRTLTVLTPAWIGVAPVYVADRLDYFEDEEITVEFVQADSRGGIGDMLSNDVDIDIRPLGSHLGVPASVEPDTVLIGTLDVSMGGDAIIVDGAIENTGDLVGRTVAVESNTPAHLLLQMALARDDVRMDAITIRDAESADATITFADTEVAAVGSFAPYVRETIRTVANREAEILIDSADEPGLVLDMIVARRDDVEARPDTYRRFLRALYRAIDYYAVEPESFADLASPFYGIRAEPLGDLLTDSLLFTDHAQAVRIVGSEGSEGSLHALFDRLVALHRRFGNTDIERDPAAEIERSLLEGLFDEVPE